MSRLIESIRLFNGVFENLHWHQMRMDKSRYELYSLESISLSGLFHQYKVPQQGLFKARVVYDTAVRLVEFQPYQHKQIKSLKAVNDNLIDYRYKWEDRSTLQKHLEAKETCDDILVIKNKLVTDSSYANIVFKKQGEWLTPHQPLLHGTMRSKLLTMDKIHEAEIYIDDIHTFESYKMINAMLGFDSEENDISTIFVE
jgi:4-amino-4-deoxychorismate lyase